MRNPYQIIFTAVLGVIVCCINSPPVVHGQSSDNTKQIIKRTATAAPAKAERSEITFSAVFAKAAAENARLRNTLAWDFGGKMQIGWDIYSALIAQTIGTDSDSDSPAFAQAVSGWQIRAGIAPTGVIDVGSLKALIARWQSQRLGKSEYPPEEKLISAPITDFYDQTRDAGLLQVERATYAAYKRMVSAAAKDLHMDLKVTSVDELAPDEKFLKIISAFRSREYQEHLRKRQPEIGRAGLAKFSAHATGQALDLYVGGEPVTTKDENRAIQVKTPVYKWLVKNASKFGFYPYFYEPWHWEFVSPRSEVKSAN